MSFGEGFVSVPLNGEHMENIEARRTSVDTQTGTLSGRSFKRSCGTILVTLCFFATIGAATVGLKTALTPERFLQLTYDKNNPLNVDALGLGLTSNGQTLVACLGAVALSIATGFLGILLNR